VAQRHVTVAELAAPTQLEELGNHPGMMHKMRMRRFFNKLERNHPELKSELTSLETRLEGLTMKQRQALRASIYANIKDETIEEFHDNVKSMIEDPTKLISFVTSHLDRVEGMSATAIDQLAIAPPNDIRALLRPTPVVGKTGQEQVTPQAPPAGEEASPEEPEAPESQPAQPTGSNEGGAQPGS
ncbi:MAG: hypothetical protein KGR26_03275, partial [Cyanobacteria bacterium REEB65]|nr:hypothetical protein [Cyanobacteria bacterium REEB65]